MTLIHIKVALLIALLVVLVLIVMEMVARNSRCMKEEDTKILKDYLNGVHR